MKITVEQSKTLRRLMLQLLDTEAKVAGFLYDNVGGRNLQQYAIASDLDRIVFLLVRAAETVTPPFLDELLAAFQREFGHDDEVKAFFAEIAPPSQRDARAIAPPYESCFVNSAPFVDRVQLRPVLKLLHDPPATAPRKPRILVVTGNPSSGKSHTKNLVNHIGAQFGFTPALVDFSRWQGELTPVDVGQRLAKRLGYDVPLGDEQLARWITIFFDTIVPKIGDDAHWIIIDFGRVSISTAVAEFIDELAVQINDSLPNVRLVLLGYSKPLTTAKRILESDTTADITDKELVQFFAQFYSEYGPELDDEQLSDRIAEHVPEVLSKMMAADRDSRYSVMEEALSAICDAIGKEA
ncbi:MAG TPA: hypothetical protein VM733_01775 [Thermoanaerobaculia bacterium]|nr:hypothetical protein [Thermoanaerobaculia bacterium]